MTLADLTFKIFIHMSIVPSELTAGGSDEKNISDLKDTMGIEIPLGRAGTDKEMASAVLFLAVESLHLDHHFLEILLKLIKTWILRIYGFFFLVCVTCSRGFGYRVRINYTLLDLSFRSMEAP